MKGMSYFTKQEIKCKNCAKTTKNYPLNNPRYCFKCISKFRKNGDKIITPTMELNREDLIRVVI